MKAEFRILELPYEFAFAISRQKTGSLVARTVLLELTTHYNGMAVTGLGEAVPCSFYGETPESVCAFYEQVISKGLLTGLDPFNIQEYESRISQLLDNHAAKAAIDMALYDMQGKILGMPLHKLWGLDPQRAPKTSYTIGLADMDTIKMKTEKALSRGYDILKVKLGSQNDFEALTYIREAAPKATIRVDANAAWSYDEAVSALPELEALGVELIEEPLALDVSDEECRLLKENSTIPLMADERCHTLHDIPRCADLFHAVNLKLTKTGGLTEAMRMIHAAKAHQLKIMLGCFGETSISISAFAQLSPLVDYADLDGSLLLAEDPYMGVQFEGSSIRIPAGPGLGVRPRV